MLRVISPKDKSNSSELVINTTSRSNNWSRGLSPFFLGPVNLYNGYVSQNFENAWQAAKVYQQHLDTNGEPSDAYFVWAQSIWNNPRAIRYPMGKGAKPQYSFWNNKKLTYIEARKNIYIPLYAKLVKETFAFKKLKFLYELEIDICLWDFDGYDHKSLNMTYDDVINDPNKKMGHAFVLAMLLEEHLK